MTGPAQGPSVVAPMNIAIALPRETGLWNISAHIPPTTTIGHAAPIPHKNLKMIKAAILGDNAEAKVKIVKKTNAPMLTIFLPYCSDIGPYTIGPRT